MDIKSGSGSVIPGTPQASLPAGDNTVNILVAKGENDGLFQYDTDGLVKKDEAGNPIAAVSENLTVKCEYPDGLTKWHQVKDVAELVDRVTTQLRNYYGVEGDITVVTAPTELVDGATLKLNIAE